VGLKHISQAVECLPSKLEALLSQTQCQKKKKQLVTAQRHPNFIALSQLMCARILETGCWKGKLRHQVAQWLAEGFYMSVGLSWTPSPAFLAPDLMILL
jgi:hypothetical protein